MGDEFSLGEIIANSIDYNMSDRWTAIPAVVLAIKDNGRDLMVDVQPLVSIKQRDGEVIPQPSVLNVPLQVGASSTAGTIFPVNVNDNVMLIFSMRGIDTWKYGNGQPQAASDYRMFNKKDCIAIPCIYPKELSIANPQKHNSDYELGDVVLFNGLGKATHNEIVLKANGDVIINSPGSISITATENITLTAAKTTINSEVQINGSRVRHNGANIGDTHVHGGITSGPSNTSVPAN